MSTPLIYESLLGFKNCDRYKAHAKIDDSLRALDREVARTWEPSLIQLPDNGFIGSLRTRDQRVMDALPLAQWKVLDVPAAGAPVQGLLEITCKARHFARFSDNEDWCFGFVDKRVGATFAFRSFTVQVLTRSVLSISKSSNAYTAPSVFVSVAGTIEDPDAYAKFLLEGIGNSKSYGLGRLIPTQSALFPFIEAASERAAHRAAERELAFG